MESLSAQFLLDLRTNNHPVWLAIITNASGTWRFVSSPNTGLSYPPSLSEVGSIGQSIDPFSRAISVGSVELTFADDGEFRDLFVSTYLYGAKVELKLGFEHYAEGAYVTRFKGTIEEVSPNEGYLTVKVKDAHSTVRDAEVTGDFIAKHPLEIMEELYTSAKVPAALIDSASFDPTVDPTKEHLCISRTKWIVMEGNALDKPQKCGALIEELLQLMDGTIHVTSGGVVTYKKWDAARAVSKHITADDIESSEEDNVFSNTANRVTVNFLSGDKVTENQVFPHTPLRVDAEGYEPPRWVAHPGATFTANNSEAQERVAYPGESERVIARDINDPWISAGSWCMDSIPASGTGTVVRIKSAVMRGFTGARVPLQSSWSATPSLTYPIDGTHKAYFQIDDEIIEFDTVAIINSPVLRDSILSLGQWVPDGVQYTVSARGCCGTAAAAHSAESFVVDVTIPKIIAEARVTRFGDGAPGIRLKLRPNHLDLELGDFVTHDDDVYLALDKSSADSTSVLEVVGKEENIDASPPHVFVTLAWARDDASPTVTPSYVIPTVQFDFNRATYANARDNVYGQKFTVSGGTGTLGGGLNVGIISGEMRWSSGRRSFSGFTQSVRASKDTYFALDIDTGTIQSHEVANGGAAPTWAGHFAPLMKVVSNATQATAITDQRVLYAISGLSVDPKFSLTDNIANALYAREGSNPYIEIDTLDSGGETIRLASAALNQKVQILGTGGLYMGNGVTASSPQAGTIRSTGAANADGSGAAMSLYGGVSKGTGEGGPIVLYTAPASVISGAADNTPVIRFWLNSDGVLYLGNGKASATAADGKIQGTEGVGTDKIGGNLYLQGGRPTGNAAGGQIIFQTAAPGASGATLRNLATTLTLSTTPAVWFIPSQNTGAFAISDSAVSALGASSTSVGFESDCTGIDGVAYGYQARSLGTRGVVVGRSSTNSGDQCVVIGYSMTGPSSGGTTNNVLVGTLCSSTQASVVGIGVSLSITGSSTVVVGGNVSSSYGANNSIVGQGTTMSGTLGAILGTGASSTTSTVAVGHAAAGSQNNCVVIGRGTAPTAQNQFVTGSSGANAVPITTLYLGGNGVTATAPSATVLWTITGGSGTNIAGSKLTIGGAGLGTGNAISTDFVVRMPNPGSSGTTLQSYQDSLVLDGITEGGDIYLGPGGKDTATPNSTIRYRASGSQTGTNIGGSTLALYAGDTTGNSVSNAQVEAWLPYPGGSSSGTALQTQYKCLEITRGVVALGTDVDQFGTTFISGGPHGGSVKIGVKVEEVTLSGATTTCTISVPGILIGVSWKVTTAITASGGGTTFSIQSTVGTAETFGTGIAFALNTMGSGEGNSSLYVKHATSQLIMTPDAGSFTAGKVKLAIHYIAMKPILN